MAPRLRRRFFACPSFAFLRALAARREMLVLPCGFALNAIHTRGRNPIVRNTEATAGEETGSGSTKTTTTR